MSLRVRVQPAVSALLLAAACACMATPCAAGPDTLREALFGSKSEDGREHRHDPEVARYTAETGATFILDRSQRRALLKFDRSGEIWALQAAPAPRGDTIFKNDIGQPVLRATRLGGLTLFTRDAPTGVAVAVAGEAPAFVVPAMTPQALVQHLARASGRASKAAKRLVPFRASDVPAGAEFVVADAANLAAEAITRLAASNSGRRLVDEIKGVRITVGRRPDVRLDDGLLRIVVAPKDGVAGRPSSLRIVHAVASAG
ncbi:DUF4908 domain-containing protein [Caulobacter sp. 17J65-9]|nr:DUF4908 domain-containing protein [Caulobacter sp. 17J65-9]